MSSSLIRFCLMILAVSLVLMSPLSYGREEQKKKVRSLRSAPEYRQEFYGADTSKLTTRLKERLDLLSSDKTKAYKHFIRDKIDQIHSITDSLFSGKTKDGLAFGLLFGALLTLALYHLCLFGLQRKDISTLYFVCLCVLTAFLYVMSVENLFIASLPTPGSEIAVKIKFVCICLGFTIFVMLIKNLFPQELSQIMLRISQCLGISFTLLALVANARIHKYVMVTYEVILLVSSIYLIYVFIRAGLKKRDGAIWLLCGFLFLIITVTNDILFDLRIVYTGQFVPFGVFIFLFAQSFVLSHGLSKSSSRAYERFLPKEFLKNLHKENIADIKLGDNAQMTMTILFADIRNFTRLSEKMTSEENFKFLNSYLELIGPVIRTYHGFIDKYIGDAIMALFDKSADDAVRGSIGMLQKLVEYNEGRKRAGYVPIQIGIGINTGSLRIGTIGERGRMEGTVIGDAVNLASRIEGMTKMYGVPLLISDATFHGLEDPSKYYIRKIGRVKVRGKREPVTLWEVFDSDQPNILRYKLDTAMIFEEALSLYQSKQFAEAQELFQDCLVRNPQDRTAQFYKDRCQLYVKMGVRENWNGIAIITSYERVID